MSNGFEQFANSVGKAIETVPDVYNDVLKPATQESGKTLSLVPRTINAALVPLRQWIAYKEYNMAETEILIAQKLAHISEEKIVTPEPYVAVPAIQAISYSMNNDELRNLYANLLAKSMNTDTKESVHPSFVEIIKQMSPNDAIIFKIIFENKITPLIDLSIESNGGQANFIYNISWITSYPPDSIKISIDNLTRLGLIDIPYGSSYTDNSNYDRVRITDYYLTARNSLASLNLGAISEEKKYIKKTELAVSFYKVCIAE